MTPDPPVSSFPSVCDVSTPPRTRSRARLSPLHGPRRATATLRSGYDDTALPGWLVLLPRRHVTAIHELTDAEATTQGTWQVRLSRALHAVTGCIKTLAHVHFHVMPRMADLTRLGSTSRRLLRVTSDAQATAGTTSARRRRLPYATVSMASSGPHRISGA